MLLGVSFLGRFDLDIDGSAGLVTLSPNQP